MKKDLTVENITINDFKKIISSSWAKETCYEPWQKDWSTENSVRGQCYVTGKLFQDLFGGDLIKAKDSNDISHYWNFLDGTEYDFTRNQYDENEIFIDKQVVIENQLNEREIILRKNFFKQLLQDRGFSYVYEWKDEAGTVYPEHAHKGHVSLYIISGSVTFSGDIQNTLVAGNRFDVPIEARHTAIVGPEGCEYIVGEEIEGDS